MALRLFGGGFGRSRTCPACDAKVAADASFCPSCYMVFRPEGAAALREHLGGSRVPADVYLLRKLQSQDPDTGPVERKPIEALTTPPPPPAPSPPAAPVAAASAPEPEPADLLIAPDPLALFQDEPELLLPDVEAASPAEDDPAPELPLTPPPPAPAPPRVRTGVESFLAFTPPLPPATRSADGLPALLAWMLEHDRVIPNNLVRLETLHAKRFDDTPVGRLNYEQHVLLLVEDDLRLHPAQEVFDAHLLVLVDAYRRATEAYQAAPPEPEQASDPLWEMAMLASRLRLEAWVYRTRFGGPPRLAVPGRRPRRPGR